MKIPIFASVIVFVIWLAYEIRKHKKKEAKVTSEFWAKEDRADATRKKSLDNLNYIEIPHEILSCLNAPIPEEISDAVKMLNHLSTQKIVNFSCITNTDLKLAYGAANLPILTEYDQNYISLARSLQEIGEYFYQHEEIAKAKILLEFALSTQTDAIGTYRILSAIYKEENNSAGIDYLISSASLLSGLTGKPILKLLKETKPEDTNLEESILHILE